MLPLLPLLAPVTLGALCGAWGLFPDPQRAIQRINLYPTWFAFPLLVAMGIARLDARTLVPEAPIVVVGALLLTLPLVRAFGVPSAGPTALVTAFGNVAYVGIPVVNLVVGPQALPFAALLIAVHMTLGIAVGPYLLVQWSAAGDRPIPWARLFLQPLLFAPVVGLGLWGLPPPVAGPIVDLLRPLGDTAPPVALFVLGLYLWVERARVFELSWKDLDPLLGKLVILPVVTYLVASWFGVGGEEFAALVLLAAVPAGITTFSLARDLRTAESDVARAILTTTAAAVLTVPIWSVLVWAGTLRFDWIFGYEPL